MIRVGIIGAGVMGRNHLRIYATLPEVQIVGIADTNEEILHQLSQQYRAPAFTDYKDLLARQPEVLSIAIPTHQHAAATLDALQAGAHVLVEKPIAHTVQQAQAMIEMAQKTRRLLMVGHVERFNPVIALVRQAAQGEDVIMINITRVGPFPSRIKDVGVIIDLAVHDIDLVRYLTGSEIKRILSLASRRSDQREDAALLSFMMENGVLAHITTNWLTPFKVREIEVATKQKLIKGWLSEQKVLEYSRYTEDRSYIVKELPVPFAEPLRLELETFLQCVRTGQPPPVTGYDGLKALEIAQRALETSQ
jgi:predicted dehydrogenase